MNQERRVMDALSVERCVTRIAHEILERNQGTENLVLVGIRTGGVFLAKRLQRVIEKTEQVLVPLGVLDVTLYRDDLQAGGPKKVMGKTDIPFSLEGKKVVLVDDVLFTGRTIRAAMDALIDFGRPRLIQLAVLVDRGHRELPIRADFIGLDLPSSFWEAVTVHFAEKNAIDEVLIKDASPGNQFHRRSKP
jgi:pyrimidine operon attenuation protein/uracil phosphoribosyltransferase